MKVAILSLALETNYGGILQTYALQTILTRLGHDVEVLQRVKTIDFTNKNIPLEYAKRILKKLLINRNIRILNRNILKDMAYISKNMSNFYNENINIRYINSLSEICPDDYDAFIVGSDQVWRKEYFISSWNTQIKEAYLDFTNNWKDIVRISYAASFGTDNLSEYTEKDIIECRNAIQNFNSVSVREDSGVLICEKYLNKTAIQVLDPTMLLSKEDYIALVNKSNTPKSSGELLCYILDTNPLKESIIKKISSDTGYRPFNVCSQPFNEKLSLEQRVQPPLEVWLRGFMDAKFVVTDSFHACVFAILFNKPFVVIGNEHRGMSRFSSLLSMFSLDKNLIVDKNIQDIQFSIPHETNQILEKYRNISIEYLKKSLNH